MGDRNPKNRLNSRKIPWPKGIGLSGDDLDDQNDDLNLDEMMV
jgi:hypothetical protein